MKRIVVCLAALCIVSIFTAGCDDFLLTEETSPISVSSVSIAEEEIQSVQKLNSVSDKETTGSDEMVWIPRTGSKYHCNAKCSGMKDPILKPKLEAENLGYEPCKNCY